MPSGRDRARVAIEARPFRDPTVQELVSEYQAELLDRIAGLDFSQAAPPGPADFDPPAGVFLVLLVAGAPAGCGGFRRLDDRTAEVRRMYLRVPFRGQGLGRRLLDELELEAIRFGFAELCLDTADELVEALALYRSAGYEEVASYNGNPHADRWLAKRLPGAPSS